MATHVGTSGVVKVGSATVAEVTGFTLNETNDTVEQETTYRSLYNNLYSEYLRSQKFIVAFGTPIIVPCLCNFHSCNNARSQYIVSTKNKTKKC